MERDRESIGLTPENQVISDAMEARGWFSKKEDFARFCMGYAIRVRVPEGVTPGTDTRWAAGNFDKSGEIRALIGALYPTCTTPVRLVEHLVNEGMGLIGSRLRSVSDIATFFEMEPEVPVETTVLYDRYEVVRRIGGGGMAETFCVKSLDDGALLFLKRVSTSGTIDEKALQREQQIYTKLQRLEDAALLRVVGWERDGQSVALVTEYADGGSLTDYVKAAGGALAVANAKKVALQIINSLAALHSAEIVHRDVKPDNAVLVGATWKLADFGIAKNLARPITQHTFIHHHTPGYAPPEQVEGSQASVEADVYAFGKLWAFMLTGQTDPDKITSPAARSLARDCTQADPASRISVQEIRRALGRLVA